LFSVQDFISQQASNWTSCWTGCKRQREERFAKVGRFSACQGLFWSNDIAWSKTTFI